MSFRRGLYLVCCLTVLLAVGVSPAAADSSTHTNKFGLNLFTNLDTRYVRGVSQICNSSGGDWGYVTVLLLSEDRANPAKVQRFLDDADRAHLIPILRLGTRFEKGIWRKPTQGEPAEWKSFLTGLRWHAPATYLVVGNELNLSQEWGSEVDPKGYAHYLSSFLDTFQDRQDRFKILNGAMDLSNPTKPGMMDAFEYLAAMKSESPQLFSRLHGWASSPYQLDESWGVRYTHRGYTQELDLIGVDLPVFIVEFHSLFEGDQERVADYYQRAFSDWQDDPRVVAATPHVYDYPEAREFWMFKVDENGAFTSLSPTATRLRGMKKVAGSPSFVAGPTGTVRGPLSTSPMPGTPAFADFPLAAGRFYTQANERAIGTNSPGFSIEDDGEVNMWSEYQRLGGEGVLGYPISRRYVCDGTVCQATQQVILQWQPQYRQATFLNIYDVIHDRGKDEWLYSAWGVPRQQDGNLDNGLSWDGVVARHMGILEGDAALKERYLSDPYPLARFGLPMSLSEVGNEVVLRCERAVLRRWKSDEDGDVTFVGGGIIARSAGLIPLGAMVLESPPPSVAANPADRAAISIPKDRGAARRR